MILIDTTVWIDWFAGHDTKQVARLTKAIEDREDLCICGVVLTEVLQGIKNEANYSRTKSIMLDLIYLPMGQETYIEAATIYRTLRSKGITIRKPIDCMIASTCLEHDSRLLHNDKDFTQIKSEFPLRDISSEE